MEKNILVAGGAGYIGSHMVRTLLENGANPVVFDNLSTGHREFVPEGVPFIDGDLLDKGDIYGAFLNHDISAVMHFAASSIVPESIHNPLKYYENNVTASINLLKAMRDNNVNKLIFSSTAAVYGEPDKLPIKECDDIKPLNPYGLSKAMIEVILKSISASTDIRYISLRYFNAAGAHESGEIGEWHDPETHLIPNVMKACHLGEELVIHGDDYPTEDGSCVRDYIHVQDLCNAHFLALKALDKGVKNEVFNLGNGSGYSVKDVINMAESVTGKRIKLKIGPRRPGDPVKLIASSDKAAKFLKWKPRFGLEEIIRTAAERKWTA